MTEQPYIKLGEENIIITAANHVTDEIEGIKDGKPFKVKLDPKKTIVHNWPARSKPENP